MNSRESVTIFVESGGSLGQINGYLQYINGGPARILPLPSPLTYSSLFQRVRKKLRLHTEFRLFYQNPNLGGKIFELGDDDDVSTFEHLVYQNLPQTLTVYVVECGGNGGAGSSTMINQTGIFPSTNYQSMYPQFLTGCGGTGAIPYASGSLFPQPYVHQTTNLGHQFPQQYQTQPNFPQQYQTPPNFPQQYQTQPNFDFSIKGEEGFQLAVEHEARTIPDLNETPEHDETLDFDGVMEDYVGVAAEMLNIPEEEDDGDDGDDRSFDEEKGIRNNFWGMPDPLPCPPLVTRPRKAMCYQPTSHVKLGWTFETKNALKLALGLKCVEEKFQIKVKRSTKKKYEAVCYVGEGCQWRLLAVAVEEGSSTFQVRRLHDEHTCSRTQVNPSMRNATPEVLGHILQGSLKDCRRMYRGNEIVQDMNQRFGITVSYMQAWRAKMRALEMLRGSPESSFNQLPVYCHNLKLHNPGTVAEIALDDEGRFDMMFVALGASISSFLEGLRLLLIMDGAHMKGTYVGTMFLAVGMDGNNQIVPIAMGVGKTESVSSWTWFLTQLRGCIGEPVDLTFVTDRAASIETSIRHVFPRAHHGLCARHLLQNLKLTSKRDKARKWMFWEACKAYRQADFDATMNLMEHSLPDAVVTLRGVGYARWARSHFPGLRYSSMTSNSAESVNSLTRFARYLPITMLVEFYRSTLQQWYYQRRQIGGRF